MLGKTSYALESEMGQTEGNDDIVRSLPRWKHLSEVNHGSPAFANSCTYTAAIFLPSSLRIHLTVHSRRHSLAQSERNQQEMPAPSLPRSLQLQSPEHASSAQKHQKTHPLQSAGLTTTFSESLGLLTLYKKPKYRLEEKLIQRALPTAAGRRTKPARLVAPPPPSFTSTDSSFTQEPHRPAERLDGWRRRRRRRIAVPRRSACEPSYL